MTLVLGYLAATITGLILGLLGAGGAILSVPIFVYIFAVPASTATGYSLFMVGTLSLVGALTYYKRNMVDVQTAITFALPSLMGVYTSRRWIVPSLPDTIIDFPVLLSKDQLLLLVFAILMLTASTLMIRKAPPAAEAEKQKRPFLFIFVLQSFFVGLLTGFVGAGGGFMIIPALVLFKKLDMKIAIGTSLLIVSITSLIGFIGDIQTNPDIDWRLLLTFCLFSMSGLGIGTRLSAMLPSTKLKPLFGYFVFVVAIFMLSKELLF